MLRFVGGKISKNEGGVKINTPSGALAIRGGMAYMTDRLFAFIYGDELVYKSFANGVVRRAFEIGYHRSDLKRRNHAAHATR